MKQPFTTAKTIEKTRPSGAKFVNPRNVTYTDLVADDIPLRKRGSISKKQQDDTRRVSDLEDFRAHAKANQWNTRRDRGIEWRKDVFEYIEEIYGEWIARQSSSSLPFTQLDLKRADEKLYQKFQVEASRRGVPERLNLPPEKDAILANVEDESRRTTLLKARELNRERMRLLRDQPKK